MPEPEVQDRVRHKTSADIVTGTVIAKYPVDKLIAKVKALGLIRKKACYPGPTKQLLDVRSDDDRIYWATPAENWEVTKAYEDGKDCE